ncbi:MAG: chloride channel protein [Planctomycetota bacterium]
MGVDYDTENEHQIGGESGAMTERRERWVFLRGVVWIAKWAALTLPLGLLVGTAAAFFLWALDRVTQWQWQHPWLLFLLPVAGAASGLLYHRWGQAVEAGLPLVLHEIDEPAGRIPLRMAPLVLLGTIVTHLCGGSAGREGTAVQVGASLASALGRWLRLRPGDCQLLMTAGIAAGFGAVFGTPLAGTLFAAEVIARKQFPWMAVVPCLFASVLGDQVTLAWGIVHTPYPLTGADWATRSVGPEFSRLDPLLVLKIIFASCLFGLASSLFVQAMRAVRQGCQRLIKRPWLRPVAGGVFVVLLALTIANRDYLGLGVNANPLAPHAVTIQSSFQVGGACYDSWLWKLIFTAVTVGSGFKGGEATPLFFIGSALGNTLGDLLGAPVELLAALGFVAVFAGATRTPLACTVMAWELFGRSSPAVLASAFPVYAAAACFVASHCAQASTATKH